MLTCHFKQSLFWAKSALHYGYYFQTSPISDDSLFSIPTENIKNIWCSNVLWEYGKEIRQHSLGEHLINKFGKNEGHKQSYL